MHTLDKRTMLVQPSTLMAVMGLFLVILSGVFISQYRVQELVTARQADALSVSYLRLLLLFQSSSIDLRLQLGEQLRTLGRYEEALEVLDSATPATSATDRELLLRRIELRWSHTNTFGSEDPSRRIELAKVTGLLGEAVGQPLPVARQIRLAQLSLAAGRADLAQRFFERLAHDDKRQRTYWWEQAARSALAANQPLRAAQLFNEAANAAGYEGEGLVLQSIAAFQAADHERDVLPLAELWLERFPESRQLRTKLVRLAMAVNDLMTAKRWNNALIDSVDNDEAALREQSEICLAIGDYQAAYELSRRMMTLLPENAELRQRTARIAEWGGHPDWALQVLEPLALQVPAGNAMREALRLAYAFPDSPSLPRLLQLQATNALLSDQDLHWLLDFFGSRTASREDFVSKYRARHGAQGDAQIRSWQLAHTPAVTNVADGARSAVRTEMAGIARVESHVLSLRKAGKAAAAITAAERASDIYHEPRMLLLAMDIAAESKRWSDLGRLLGTVDRHQDSYFKQSTMYWVLKATHAASSNAWQDAVAAYEQALSINPTAIDIKSALLWQLNDADNTALLRVYLPKWQSEARSLPALWPAYAAGYMKLGRTDLALPWFERHRQRHPDDLLWSLSYADALTAAGRTDVALRLRETALGRLLDRLKSNPSQPLSNADMRLWLGYQEQVSAQTVARFTGGKALSSEQIQMVIGRALELRNDTSVRAWVTKAQAQRLKVPAWQRLALALRTRDRSTLLEILEHEESTLTLGDKVQALRMVGRSGSALNHLQRHLDGTR